MTRVVFVAGAARSGSTLLGEILGAQPGVLDVGEIALLWRDAARGNRCACGEPIVECELWGRVLARLDDEHGIGPDDLPRLAAARARLARTSRPARLVRLLRGAAPNAVEARLLEATRLLQATALEEAGAEVLVDASKTLPALLLQRLVADDAGAVQVVHLVRDAPAVVASTVRSRGVARGNADSLPPGGSAPVAVGRWLWSNATATLGRRTSPGAAVVLRYEDLVADPSAVTAGLCRRLGVPWDPTTLADGALHRTRTSHAAVGNPGRGGQVTPIVLDERWRDELAPGQVRAVRAITAPAQHLLHRAAVRDQKRTDQERQA